MQYHYTDTRRKEEYYNNRKYVLEQGKYSFINSHPLEYYYTKDKCSSIFSIFGCLVATTMLLYFVGYGIYSLITTPSSSIWTLIQGALIDGICIFAHIFMIVVAMASTPTLYLRFRIFLIILFALIIALDIYIVADDIYSIVNATTQEAKNQLFINMAQVIITSLGTQSGLLFSFFIFHKHDDLRYIRYALATYY